ncbi:hypothetical protein Hamer_G007358 [Homarus americanus]|uniref:Uncharacterized protein n=1 Tax=Homarus americanus TaxID=6706 RepID=A0A8J5MRX6_HOMAM|nr:hypothetical protein Hamer_G007358 [Homarus americanus]
MTKYSLPLQQGRGPGFCPQGSLQGAMQEMNNLQQEVYLSGSMSHQRLSPQMRHHPHSQHLASSPTRLHYHPTLLSPPTELSRSISDSSIHQNVVQGKTVNSRKDKFLFAFTATCPECLDITTLMPSV